MREIAYAVRGFLTVRRDSWRVPLSGSLAVHADPGSGLFTGDLVLRPSTISRGVLGVSIFTATVQIVAGSPVIGGVDPEGRTVRDGHGRRGYHCCPCRRVAIDQRRLMPHRDPAVVPLRSRPGFRLEQGGRLVGSYDRPPFTGCGWLTPLVNLLAAGPGNAAVIDLIPRTSDAGSVTPGSRPDAP